MKKFLMLFLLLMPSSFVYGGIVASGSVTQANAKKSLVDGASFIDIAVDLSAYAHADSGDHKHIFKLVDSAGKIAWGYIGASGGGETLGSNKATNGNMETGDPPTGWDATNATPDGVADERDGGTGAQSIDVVSSAAYGRVSRVLYTITVGKLYKVSLWHKNLSGGHGCYRLGLPYPATMLSVENLSDAAWTQKTGYLVATSAALGEVFLYSSFTDYTVGDNSRFDDVSTKEVTDCSTNGLHILSTRGGSVQNWAGIETGFNYNDASGYTYEIKTIGKGVLGW